VLPLKTQNKNALNTGLIVPKDVLYRIFESCDKSEKMGAIDKFYCIVITSVTPKLMGTAKISRHIFFAKAVGYR
jgi:hypothetical protein